EPFPEYWQSCETQDAHVDEQLEQAYRYAISKVCEEVIRFRDLDASVTSPLPFAMDSLNPSPSTPATTDGNVDSNNRDTDTPVPPTTQPEAPMPQPQLFDVPAAYPTHERECSEEWKQETLADVKRLILSDKLKTDTKRRFIAMCNLILRIEYLLFRRHPVPVDPVTSLSTEEVEEVFYHATELIKYVTIIDNILTQEYAWAQRVQYSVAFIASDTRFNVVMRFKNMSEVIIRHLKKPRPTEQQLLTLVLDFYDTFMYRDYLKTHPKPVEIEAYWDPTREQLTAYLAQIWNTINHSIEMYDAIVQVNSDLKETYVGPAFRDMEEAPRIWRDVLVGHYLEQERARLR
ncbi:hypothetical protein BO70DRAFT_277543, partial [Aspergillus heteromorphus CBS 117.55]